MFCEHLLHLAECVPCIKNVVGKAVLHGAWVGENGELEMELERMSRIVGGGGQLRTAE